MMVVVALVEPMATMGIGEVLHDGKWAREMRVSEVVDVDDVPHGGESKWANKREKLGQGLNVELDGFYKP